MDILSMLSQQLGDPKALEEMSKKAGAQPGQVQQIAQAALPTLLKALQQNAATPEGAKALDKALEAHKDDKVDDILSFLKNVDQNDGAKMLNHIFSNRNDAVQTDLAQKVGVEKNQVAALLTQLAPLVIGALGNQKKEQGSESSPLNILGSVLGGFLKK